MVADVPVMRPAAEIARLEPAGELRGDIAAAVIAAGRPPGADQRPGPDTNPATSAAAAPMVERLMTTRSAIAA